MSIYNLFPFVILLCVYGQNTKGNFAFTTMDADREDLSNTTQPTHDPLLNRTSSHYMEGNQPTVPLLSSNMIYLPTYSVYLIGCLMLIMLAIIICVTIMYIKKIKPVLRDSFRSSKNYARQSRGPILDDMSVFEYGGNASTLTINSGIIDINKNSEPATPQTEKDIKLFNKSVLDVPPLVSRKQMDDVIMEVLNKLHAKESTGLMDLEQLKSENAERNFLPKEENNAEELVELDVIYHELPSRVRCLSKIMSKSEKRPPLKTEPDQIQTQQLDQILLKKDTSNLSADKDDEDNLQQIIDEFKPKDIKGETNPVYTMTDAEVETFEPRMNGEVNSDGPLKEEKDDIYESALTQDTVVILDVDSDYLLPLTSSSTSSYINARCPQSN